MAGSPAARRHELFRSCGISGAASARSESWRHPQWALKSHKLQIALPLRAYENIVVTELTSEEMARLEGSPGAAERNGVVAPTALVPRPAVAQRITSPPTAGVGGVVPEISSCLATLPPSTSTVPSSTAATGGSSARSPFMAPPLPRPRLSPRPGGLSDVALAILSSSPDGTREFDQLPGVRLTERPAAGVLPRHPVGARKVIDGVPAALCLVCFDSPCSCR